MTKKELDILYERYLALGFPGYDVGDKTVLRWLVVETIPELDALAENPELDPLVSVTRECYSPDAYGYYISCPVSWGNYKGEE